MLEMVVYAERVPKVSKGNMWKDNEVLRFVLLFLFEWSSGLSAGLWVGRPGFESWPGHYVVALSKPLHSPCFVFSDKTLSRRSRLLQGLG